MLSRAGQFLWTEKYRPRLLDECILPKNLRKMFQGYIDAKEIPSLMFAGPPGTGKTTLAKVLTEAIDADVFFVNSSMHGNIDTLRHDLMQFASTVSFSGGRKYIILDEGDGLTAQAQKALRGLIEECASNCGVIITCNLPNLIMDAIDSRMTVVNFHLTKEERNAGMIAFLKRVCKILDAEGVTYDKAVLAKIIDARFPDCRKILGDLQSYSMANKTIDVGILALEEEQDLAPVIEWMKDRHFTNIRKWVAENSYSDIPRIFNKLYKLSDTFLQPESVPQLTIILADYQHKLAFAADPEVTFAAAMAEVMVKCDYKR